MSDVPQPRDDRLIQFSNRNFSLFSVQNNIHCVPVDEIEEQRLDELNRILKESLGRIVFAPFPPQRVEEPAVLDCGFGKGAWIDDLLGQFDNVEVTGIDVFLGRGNGDDPDEEDEDSDEGGIEEFIKKRWNLNAPFREDRSDSRLRPETFDFVNSRLLADGINADRWRTYVKDLYNVLKPGGWLQMMELHMLFQSDSGRDTAYLRRWNEWYSSAMTRMNKDPRIGRQLQTFMTSAGFEQVQGRAIPIPIGNWRADMAGLGNDHLELVHHLLFSMSLWPFLRVMNMEPETYRSLIIGAQAELRVPGLKLYYTAYVAWGRRPSRRR